MFKAVLSNHSKLTFRVNSFKADSLHSKQFQTKQFQTKQFQTKQFSTTLRSSIYSYQFTNPANLKNGQSTSYWWFRFHRYCSH
jgi:hypothetical protein